jgi:pimeloyl-ACP methyl ester carboxylesterase
MAVMTARSASTIDIAYDDQGSDLASGSETVLVLVHGHPFDRSMWRPQLQHLQGSGVRVIAADLRGYGDSSVSGEQNTLDVFAADLAALLDHLDVDRVVLGGLSMGGQIVMEFHRLFPQRVRGLLLAATSARAETAAGRRNRYELANRLLQAGMADYADEMLPKMVAPHNLHALPELGRHVSKMMRNTSPVGAAAAMRGRAERPDYLASLATATVPALVVVGTHDEFTPVADAELLADTITDSTLVVVDGAAHMPNLERPAEFDLALDTFLDRLTTSPILQKEMP